MKNLILALIAMQMVSLSAHASDECNDMMHSLNSSRASQIGKSADRTVEYAPGKMLVYSRKTGEVFLNREGTLTQLNRLAEVRDQELSLLPNGKVVVSGGSIGMSANTKISIIDPSQQTETWVADAHEQRLGHEQFVLDDKSILLVGGRKPFGWKAPSIEQVDLNTGMSKQIDLKEATAKIEALSVKSGTLNLSKNLNIDTAKIFESSPRDRVIEYASGKKLFYLDRSGEVFFYDVKQESFEAFVRYEKIAGQKLSLRSDGKIVLTGGWLKGRYPKSTVSIIDPIRKTETVMAKMQDERQGYLQILINDRSLLLIGGEMPTHMIESIDLETGRSHIIGTTRVTRPHQLKLLEHGDLVVMGDSLGWGNQGLVDVIDLSIGRVTSMHLETPRYNAEIKSSGIRTITFSGGVDRAGNALTSEEVIHY